METNEMSRGDLILENTKLHVENQSLHDQIIEMENERLKIYKLANAAKVMISQIQAT